MSKLLTFDQAVQLKKLGYNKGSYNFYLFDKAKETEDSLTEHGKFENWNLLDHLNLHIGYATAPTVSEALDWIREEKGVMLAVELESKRSRLGEIIGYEYGGAYIDDKGKDVWLPTHPTHPLAESALLNAVLDYLSIK